MPAFRLSITTGSDSPIYRQIVDKVRLAVATGALVPGDALPSVRILAEQLVINANTVAKAYGELVRDGVLDSRQSLGFFVAARRRILSEPERRRRLRRAAEEFIHQAIFLDFTSEEIYTAVERELAGLEWGARSAPVGK